VTISPTAAAPQTTEIIAPHHQGLVNAAAILGRGGLVAFPTETVYGLGADAGNPDAVARLYAAKGRPHFNPLIAHVPSYDDARHHGDFNALALKLAQHFWPGPLTLVVPALPTSGVCELARAGLTSLAIRVPNHPIALALLKAVGRPVVAPSANLSGHISPTTAAHVVDDMSGRIDAVVDGGPTHIGVESTIIACLDDHPVLLRAGGLARSDIETVVGCTLREPKSSSHDQNTPLAPGMLHSHYAPHAPVRLDARAAFTDEAVLDFGGQMPDALVRLDLSPRADVVEAAAHLYDYMRRLDHYKPKAIAVAPIPSRGLGEAINDRLLRAAAPR
jgi:L-threonylcarbamoyladenylate synthase